MTTFAGALLGLDVQVAKDDEELNSHEMSTIIPTTFIRKITAKLGPVPLFIDIYGGAKVGTSGYGVGNMRAIGPGFWYDNSVTLGIRYSRLTGWTLIRDRTLTIMTRKPAFDLTGPLTLHVKLYITATFSIYGMWDIDVGVDPYFQIVVNPWACGNGHAHLDYYMGVDGRLTVNPIVLQLGLPRVCKATACFGPYAYPVELPHAGMLPYTYNFPIVG